jgi:hypothetical protein
MKAESGKRKSRERCSGEGTWTWSDNCRVRDREEHPKRQGDKEHGGAEQNRGRDRHRTG